MLINFFFFLNASPPPGVWWRWTTTALGSTTVAATWTTPTSPASCCWLHWAAHTLPSSSLWPCTRSCMRGWVLSLPNVLTFHTDVITNVKLFSFPLAADIIWLEHGEDWHECCASVPAPHALQCSRLCCHTLCLRLGTGHHYCRWHAFHHTGKVFIGVYNLQKLLAMKYDINHDHCWINLAQPENLKAEFSFEKKELFVKQLVAISPNQYIMTGI